MIFHSIRFELKNGVTQEQLDRALKQLHKMGTEIPELAGLVSGLKSYSGSGRPE